MKWVLLQGHRLFSRNPKLDEHVAGLLVGRNQDWRCTVRSPPPRVSQVRNLPNWPLSLSVVGSSVSSSMFHCVSLHAALPWLVQETTDLSSAGPSAD